MNIFNKIYSYMFGTVRIKISGDYCERMLNVIATNNISFWKPKRKNDSVYITVLLKDIKKIRALRKNIGVKIKFSQRKGFPFVYSKYKHRYGLLIGIILFLVILNILSDRLWIIKINGNQAVSDTQIYDFFTSKEVKSGVMMDEIDSGVLKQELIMSFKNIAWASLNKQGSVLEVNLTEFDNQNKNESPSNITSEYDAVVKKIDVSKGSVAVKVGDTVSKGQLLVSGIVNYGAGNAFVHSSGEILAEIHEKQIVKVKKITMNCAPSGKVLKRKALNFMGMKIPLYLGGVAGDYSVENTKRNLKLFGQEIPVVLYEKKYIFENRMFYEINESDAKDISYSMAEKYYKELDGKIIKIELQKMSDNSNEYIFEYNVICVLNIGKESPIVTE